MIEQASGLYTGTTFTDNSLVNTGKKFLFSFNFIKKTLFFIRTILWEYETHFRSKFKSKLRTMPVSVAKNKEQTRK